MNIALMCGDLHMADSAWKHVKEAAGDAAKALRQVVDLATKFDVPLVLAGDIFDAARPAPEVVLEFVRGIERLPEHLPCYYVLGNHDDRSARSWPALSERCTPIGGFTAVVHGVRMTGIDFMPPWVLKAHLAETEFDADVLVMHQPWLEIAGGRIGNSLAEIRAQPGTVVFTGDYHKRVELTYGPQELRVISPGSLYLTAIDEEVTKQVYLLSLTAGQLAWQPIQLESRAAFMYQVRQPGEIPLVVEEVLARPDGPYKPAVRIRYAAELSPEPFRALRSKAVLFLEPVRDFDARPVDAEIAQQPETLESAIDKATTDPDVAAFARSICRMRGDDLRASLQTTKAKFFDAYGAT